MISDAVSLSKIDKIYNEAVEHHKAGRLPQAEALYRNILNNNPKHADALCMLGLLAGQVGRNSDALELIKKSLAIKPDSFLAHSSMGGIYHNSYKFAEAEAAHKKALKLNPSSPEIYNNLGDVLREQGKVTEAIENYRKALAIKPRDSVTYVNLGNAVFDTADVVTAMKYYQKAIEINPSDRNASSNLLLMMHYDPSFSRKALFAEARKWAEKFTPESLMANGHDNVKDPGRKLRIGYVSGDFKNHPVGYYIETVILNHDRKNFEIYCYANQRYGDALTLKITQNVDQLRNICALDDEAAAKLIIADKIDILIDLAGHTRGNRLLLFARKPAPLQITWIGYFDTTGMKSMDYILCDKYLILEGEEKYYTEKPLYIRGCYLCLEKPDSSPAVSELPALKNGYVTFASFNNSRKLTEEVILCWAEVMSKIPHSRILLKSRVFIDKEVCKRFTLIFRQKGIGEERIKFSGHTSTEQMFAEYGEVDIAFDPFPFNGNTTTSHALFSGIPVITLSGNQYAWRMSESILTAIGREEWVARTVAEYIEKAVTLAADFSRLAEIRKNLRNELLNSSLYDGKSFTSNLEGLYRDIWKNWCRS